MGRYMNGGLGGGVEVEWKSWKGDGESEQRRGQRKVQRGEEKGGGQDWVMI